MLNDLPRRLGGAGLWLAIAVALQYPASDPAMIGPDKAQQFIRDWQFAQTPIEILGLSDSAYRQVGGVVAQDPAGRRDKSHWWLLALHDEGGVAGAHVLAHHVAANPATGDMTWRGLPPGASDGTTVPVRRDEVEISLYLLTLLDLLTAH